MTREEAWATLEKGVREHHLSFRGLNAEGKIQFFSVPTQHKAVADLVGVAMVLRDYLSGEFCWQCENWAGFLPCRAHGKERWTDKERAEERFDRRAR